MPAATDSGAPPSKLPDPRTAEDLVSVLEAQTPAEVAAIPGAMAALIRCIEELDETIMALTHGIERSLDLRLRLGTILLQAQAARADKWAPRPGGKVANGYPNRPRMPQD